MGQDPAVLLRDPERTSNRVLVSRKNYEQYRDVPDPESRVICCVQPPGRVERRRGAKSRKARRRCQARRFVNKIEICFNPRVRQLDTERYRN